VGRSAAAVAAALGTFHLGARGPLDASAFVPAARGRRRR
jgi:hypothetical protein